MRTSRHLVSLRMYGLAFAVALSPAFFQTAYSCGDRGNASLSALEFELDCNNGKANYSSTLPGFSAGSQNLVRLTFLQDSGCLF